MHFLVRIALRFAVLKYITITVPLLVRCGSWFSILNGKRCPFWCSTVRGPNNKRKTVPIWYVLVSDEIWKLQLRTLNVSHRWIKKRHGKTNGKRYGHGTDTVRHGTVRTKYATDTVRDSAILIRIRKRYASECYGHSTVWTKYATDTVCYGHGIRRKRTRYLKDEVRFGMRLRKEPFRTKSGTVNRLVLRTINRTTLIH